jgi:redox-sensitive bicupin YhaK (pirin superfamily)
MVDVRLAPHTVFEQELPASYNGFLYPLDGNVRVGEVAAQTVSTGQIAWLAAGQPGSTGTVRLAAGDSSVRVLLYAGEQQNVPIVTQGPFVGESRADLMRLAQLYTGGRMPRVSELEPR